MFQTEQQVPTRTSNVLSGLLPAATPSHFERAELLLGLVLVVGPTPELDRLARGLAANAHGST